MDERKLQYDRCRVERNRCEKIFSYCMAGILLLGIVELIVYGFTEILILAAGNQITMYSLILRIPYLVLAFLGVAKRNWLLCVAALVVFLGICILDNSLAGFSFLALIVMLVTCRSWERLKLEEGFPNFEYNEIEHAQEAQRDRDHSMATGHRVSQGSDLPNGVRVLPQVQNVPDAPQEKKIGEMDTI